MSKVFYECLNSVGNEIGENITVPGPEYSTMLLNFQRELLKLGNTCGYLFSGSFGTGKTILLIAIRQLLDLLKGVPSAWSYQSIGSLEWDFMKATEMRFPIASQERFRIAATAPVLFIDDLGMEGGSEDGGLAIELMKMLIQFRYDARMLTFIATPYDMTTIQEVYGNRIASIINSAYFSYEFDWPTLRRRRDYET